MTRRPTSKQPANLNSNELRSGIRRLNLRIDELEAFDPSIIPEQFSADKKAIEASIDNTLSRVFGTDTADYGRYSNAAYLDDGPHFYNDHFVPPHEWQTTLEKSKQTSIALLKKAVLGLEEELAERDIQTDQTVEVISTEKRELSSKVFVVHGHNQGPREAVARFLERINLEPIVLHEQPNSGQTIIEKFEKNSADVSFAIILLTDDDVGGAGVDALQPRARQNVILELGYFIGKLGRDRVCAIRSGDIELPSDILGIVWTNFDDNGGWKMELGKELKAAGHEIDWNKIMSP